MWDCIKCGCKAIAHGLGHCPRCFKPKEEAVPKITVGGGMTNAWDQESAVPSAASATAPEAPAAAPEAAQEPTEAQQAQEADKDVLSELEAAAASLQRPAKATKQDG
jgi:hypothetical protein